MFCAAAPLLGRRVGLRALLLSDVYAIYKTATAPESVGRWRLAGATPTLEAFTESVWADADINFVLYPRDEPGTALGLVQAYDMSQRNATASVAVLLDPKVWGMGWPLEGLVLFINYLFCGLELRKLYFYTPSFNVPTLAGLIRRWLVEEGRLPEGRYYEGETHAVHIHALYRSGWDSNLALQITGNRRVTTSQ